MANEKVNIVIYNGATLIDLTPIDAIESDVAQGKKFVKANGEMAIGTATGGGGQGIVTITDTLDQHGGTIRTITTHGVAIEDNKSVTPTTSQQVIYADEGYDALDHVTIGAIPTGTAGTPTATKGSVSNHTISVTPSVTNTTGYITGDTKTGSAVSVSASELVSGTLSVTQNGQQDVTNYQYVNVNVSGGSSKNIQVNSGSAEVHTNVYTSTGHSLTVAKTGTYKVSWTAWRSSSSGTMGTNLYINGTAGTNQTTWTRTYGQHIVLNNQSLNKDDVLTLYATAGSTSRYCSVAGLTIEEQ